jgi:arsenite oxidase small subunit
MTLGVVFVTVGIASVAKSLFAPSTAPPAPPPPTTATKTVTTTVLSTTTLGSGQTMESSSSSSSESTASTSTPSGSAGFPALMVANISDLAKGPVSFNYPLQETPNLLVKMGIKSEGGVGPDGDIVAFSQFCQHLGCVWGFVPPGTSPACDNTFKSSTPKGYCCCHGSVFDLANGGKVVDGPSPRPVPQVILSFDSATGDISAIGMGPPTIFGHSTGSTDVSADLVGGALVSG